MKPPNQQLQQSSFRPVTTFGRQIESGQTGNNVRKLVKAKSMPNISFRNAIDYQSVIPKDVCKSGYMREYMVSSLSTCTVGNSRLHVQTNRRKYFVLRTVCHTDMNRATLSYYGNEKKFLENPSVYNQLEHRTTLLRDVFGIDRIFDQNHKYVMAIYTEHDVLAMICDDESQLEEWMDIIQFLLLKRNDPSRPFRVFG